MRYSTIVLLCLLLSSCQNDDVTDMSITEDDPINDQQPIRCSHFLPIINIMLNSIL